MRHLVTGKKFNRTSAHRKALFINLSTSLLQYGRIKTTLAKAKELRRVVEKLVTLSKKGDLNARRQVLKKIKNKLIVKKLFDQIAPKYSNRPGGYTRILKLGSMRLDGARMAIIELVESGEEIKNTQMEADGSQKNKGKKSKQDKKMVTKGKIKAKAKGSEIKTKKTKKSKKEKE